MQAKAVKDGNSNFDVRHMREVEYFLKSEVILPLADVKSCQIYSGLK